jgi:hypothetical protein
MSGPDSYTVEYTPHAGGGSFAPMPAGTQHVVCVDGIYLGEKVETFPGAAPKVVKKYAFVFQSEELNPETNRPYEISKEFTISMHEKASLRKFLSAWRGKTYTDEEARAVDLARVVGANGIASVEHKTSQAGRTYGALLSIAPVMKGMTKLTATGYERGAFWADRKAEYAAGVAQHRASMTPAPAPHAANGAPAARTTTVPMGVAGNADWAPVREPDEVPF